MGISFSIFNKGGESRNLKHCPTHLFPEDLAPSEDNDRNPPGRTAGTRLKMDNPVLVMSETPEDNG